MSEQEREQRERWARMFGWKQLPKPIDSWMIPWEAPNGDLYENGLPNFAALDGLYFGPAVKELLMEEYELTFIGGIGFWWRKWTHTVDNFGGKEYRVLARNGDIGICTMLALEAKRAANPAQ